MFFQWKLKCSILIINKLSCQDFSDTENLLQQERFQKERGTLKIHCQGPALQNRLEWFHGYTVSVYRKGKICKIIFPKPIKHIEFEICWQVRKFDGLHFFWCTLKSWPWKDLNNSLFSPICPQPVNQISIGGQAVKQELDIVWYQQNQDGIDGIIRIWRNRDLGLEE